MQMSLPYEIRLLSYFQNKILSFLCVVSKNYRKMKTVYFSLIIAIVTLSVSCNKEEDGIQERDLFGTWKVTRIVKESYNTSGTQPIMTADFEQKQVEGTFTFSRKKGENNKDNRQGEMKYSYEDVSFFVQTPIIFTVDTAFEWSKSNRAPDLFFFEFENPGYRYPATYGYSIFKTGKKSLEVLTITSSSLIGNEKMRFYLEK
jgi:hypothetical protein